MVESYALRQCLFQRFLVILVRLHVKQCAVQFVILFLDVDIQSGTVQIRVRSQVRFLWDDFYLVQFHAQNGAEKLLAKPLSDSRVSDHLSK